MRPLKTSFFLVASSLFFLNQLEKIDPFQIIGGSEAAAATAPAPGTSAARDWESAVAYYEAAQAAKGRMAQHAVGTWQYDSAKKNYDHNIRQYIAFAARAGATVTADTPPSQAFSGSSSSASNSSSGSSSNSSSSSSQQSSDSATPSVSNGTRVNVSSGGALASALKNARCGQAITLTNGNYSGGPFTVNVNCSTSNPLVIQASSPLNAVVNTAVNISGRSVHVRGIYFRGPNIQVTVGGNDHKLLGNKFEGWATHMAVKLVRGQNIEIAYNEFTRPDPFTTGQLGQYPLRIGIRSSHLPDEFHYNAHVHHNYFYDFPNKPNAGNYSSGQTDAIEVCYTGTMTRSNWVIEYNLIDRHRQGHALIDIKCSNGAIARYNTIINSPNGRIDFRNGNGGQMIANWIENAGGLSVNGDNHQIIGNVLTGSGYPEIILSTGNVASNGTYNDTQSANNNTVSCNRGLHTVGKYNMTHPARNNTINSANGRIDMQRQTGTRVTSNGCNGVATARRLSVSEVGSQGFAKSGR